MGNGCHVHEMCRVMLLRTFYPLSVWFHDCLNLSRKGKKHCMTEREMQRVLALCNKGKMFREVTETLTTPLSTCSLVVRMARPRRKHGRKKRFLTPQCQMKKQSFTSQEYTVATSSHFPCFPLNHTHPQARTGTHMNPPLTNFYAVTHSF